MLKPMSAHSEISHETAYKKVTK